MFTLSASDLKKVTQQVAQGLPPNLATQQSLEIRSMYIPHDKKGDVRSAAPEIKAQNEIHKLKTDIEKLVKRWVGGFCEGFFCLPTTVTVCVWTSSYLFRVRILLTI